MAPSYKAKVANLNCILILTIEKKCNRERGKKKSELMTLNQYQKVQIG